MPSMEQQCVLASFGFVICFWDALQKCWTPWKTPCLIVHVHNRVPNGDDVHTRNNLTIFAALTVGCLDTIQS